MGYRHSEAEILAAAVTVAVERGMAGLTFGAVGERLGISDRTVVYYFPTKPALVTAVAQALGADLQVLLEAAFGSHPLPAADLLERAWPALTTPEADRAFGLFFEMVGLASAGQAPYDVLAPAVVDTWVTWLGPRVRGSTPEIRHRRALALMAQLDGLLLVRRLLGPDAAELARHETRGGSSPGRERPRSPAARRAAR